MNNVEQHILVTPIEGWNCGWRRPVCLWNRIRFFPTQFHDLTDELEEARYNRPLRDSKAQKRRTTFLLRAIERSGEHLDLIKMEQSATRFEEFRDGLSRHQNPSSGNRQTEILKIMVGQISPDVVKAPVGSTLGAIRKELSASQLAGVLSDKVQFFEHESLFGSAVNSAFPSAAPHIKDAGNCLAMEFNSAAIFHLILAAEFGLRSLARRLKVKLKRPMECSDWGSVVDAVERELSSLSPRSKRGNTHVQFYLKALEDCRFFKDICRNNLFHARHRVNELEAMNALTRVRDFMQRLTAQGFREKNK